MTESNPTCAYSEWCILVKDPTQILQNSREENDVLLERFFILEDDPNIITTIRRCEFQLSGRCLLNTPNRNRLMKLLLDNPISTDKTNTDLS